MMNMFVYSIMNVGLTVSSSFCLKKSMLAKKMGEGIRKIITPSGSEIWQQIIPFLRSYFFYIYPIDAVLTLELS